MHHPYRLGVCLLILLSVTAGCASVKVSQDYDVTTDFSRLQTYAWHPGAPEKSGGAPTDNPLLASRIRAAVEKNLSQMGYRKIETGSPDFYVTTTYSVRSKIDSGGVRTGVGIGIGGSGTFGSVGVSGSPVREIKEGTLVIDVSDANQGGLLWRGTGTYEVKPEKDPQKTTEKINRVVEKIMAQFPPQPQG
jgi:hypothetical protein